MEKIQGRSESPVTSSLVVNDDIIDLHLRIRRDQKPGMRLDAAELRNSELHLSLAQFLAQLAQANRDLEARIANGAGAHGFELTDEEAAGRAHIQMNLLAGFLREGPDHPSALRLSGQESPVLRASSPAYSSSSSLSSLSSLPSSSSESEDRSSSPPPAVLHPISSVSCKRKAEHISESASELSSSLSVSSISPLVLSPLSSPSPTPPRKTRVLREEQPSSDAALPLLAASKDNSVKQHQNGGELSRISTAGSGHGNASSTRSCSQRIEVIRVPRQSSPSSSDSSLGKESIRIRIVNRR